MKQDHYGVQPQAPTTAHTVTYEALHPDPDDGSWYETLNVLGIGRRHAAFSNLGGTVIVYFQLPEYGVPSSDDWTRVKHDTPAWDLSGLSDRDRVVAQCAAELWILQQAHIEVAYEDGVGL